MLTAQQSVRVQPLPSCRLPVIVLVLLMSMLAVIPGTSVAAVEITTCPTDSANVTVTPDVTAVLYDSCGPWTDLELWLFIQDPQLRTLPLRVRLSNTAATGGKFLLEAEGDHNVTKDIAVELDHVSWIGAALPIAVYLFPATWRVEVRDVSFVVTDSYLRSDVSIAAITSSRVDGHNLRFEAHRSDIEASSTANNYLHVLTTGGTHSNGVVFRSFQSRVHGRSRLGAAVMGFMVKRSAIVAYRMTATAVDSDLYAHAGSTSAAIAAVFGVASASDWSGAANATLADSSAHVVNSTVKAYAVAAGAIGTSAASASAALGAAAGQRNQRTDALVRNVNFVVEGYSWVESYNECYSGACGCGGAALGAAGGSASSGSDVMMDSASMSVSTSNIRSHLECHDRAYGHAGAGAAMAAVGRSRSGTYTSSIAGDIRLSACSGSGVTSINTQSTTYITAAFGIPTTSSARRTGVTSLWYELADTTVESETGCFGGLRPMNTPGVTSVVSNVTLSGCATLNTADPPINAPTPLGWGVNKAYAALGVVENGEAATIATNRGCAPLLPVIPSPTTTVPPLTPTAAATGTTTSTFPTPTRSAATHTLSPSVSATLTVSVSPVPTPTATLSGATLSSSRSSSSTRSASASVAPTPSATASRSAATLSASRTQTPSAGTTSASASGATVSRSLSLTRSAATATDSAATRSRSHSAGSGSVSPTVTASASPPTPSASRATVSGSATGKTHTTSPTPTTSVSIGTGTTSTTASQGTVTATATASAAPTASAPVTATVSLVYVAPIRVKPTVKVVAEAVQVSTTTTTTTASMAAANPSVATQAGKMNALRGAMDCSDAAQADDAADEHADANGGTKPPKGIVPAEQPPFFDHPLRFAMPSAGATEQYNVAIVVGDIVIFIAVTLIVTCVVAPIRMLRYFSKKAALESDALFVLPYRSALSWCRFPALLSVPAALLLPGMATAGASSAFSISASATPTARAIGAIGLLVSVMAVPVGVLVYRRLFRREFVWVVDGTATADADAGKSDADDDDADSPLMPKGDGAGEGRPASSRPITAAAHRRRAQAASMFTSRIDSLIDVADREWAARDGARSHALLRHFGMLFENYRNKAPWFYLAELGFAIGVNVLTGIKDTIGCDALAWTLAVAYTVMAVVMVVFRPHMVRLDQIMYFALAAAQAVAAVFGAITVVLVREHGANATSTNRSRTTASFFLSAIGMSAGLVGVYELMKLFYLQVQLRRRKRREKEAGRLGTLEDRLLTLDEADVNNTKADEGDDANQEQERVATNDPFALNDFANNYNNSGRGDGEDDGSAPDDWLLSMLVPTPAPADTAGTGGAAATTAAGGNETDRDAADEAALGDLAASPGTAAAPADAWLLDLLEEEPVDGGGGQSAQRRRQRRRRVQDGCDDDGQFDDDGGGESDEDSREWWEYTDDEDEGDDGALDAAGISKLDRLLGAFTKQPPRPQAAAEQQSSEGAQTTVVPVDVARSDPDGSNGPLDDVCGSDDGLAAVEHGADPDIAASSHAPQEPAAAAAAAAASVAEVDIDDVLAALHVDDVDTDNTRHGDSASSAAGPAAVVAVSSGGDATATVDIDALLADDDDDDDVPAGDSAAASAAAATTSTQEAALPPPPDIDALLDD